MSSARRIVRPWRAWAALLAAATLFPWLYERRPGGAADRERWTLRAGMLEALAEEDPGPVASECSALIPKVTGDLRLRLLWTGLRSRIRLLEMGRSTAADDARADLRSIRQEGPLPLDRIRWAVCGGAANAFDEPSFLARALDDAAADALADPGALQSSLREERDRARLEGPLPPGASAPARCRRFFLLDLHSQAVAAARDAGETGLYFEAESLRRLGHAGAEEPAALLARSRAVSAPLGHLVIGRSLLDRGDSSGWLHLEQAVAAVHSGFLVRRAALNTGELLGDLLERARSATGFESVRRAIAFLRRWHHQFPGKSGVLIEGAAIASKAARTRHPDMEPAPSRELHRLAKDLYLEEAGREGAEPAEQAQARRSAAEEAQRAGDGIEAADLFGNVYEESGGRDLQALLQQAVCLSASGLQRQALQRLDLFLSTAPPSDVSVPTALLERARIYERIGDPRASEDLDVLLSGTSLSLSPLSSEWKEALRLKGGIEWRRGDRPAARAAWVEYSERIREGGLTGEAAGAQVMISLIDAEEGMLEAALARLDALRSAPSFAEVLSADWEDTVLAGIVAGDVYRAAGRGPEARQMYQLAVSAAHRDPQWQVMALVGSARAAALSGRGVEAGDDLRRAVRVCDGARGRVDPDVLGLLERVRREIRP